MRSVSTELRSRPRAFTLVELLVVVAIVALLVALILVGLQHAQFLSRQMKCLSNQRMIALAQASYATDNGGAYASNQTQIWPGFNFNFSITNACGTFPILINNGSMVQTSYHGWVAAYTPNLITDGNGVRELSASLEKGRLWSYIGNLGAYRSPLEPPSDRVRSYSINGFFGATIPEDGFDRATVWNQWFCAKGVTPHEWRSTHVARIRHPSQMICSIIEDDRRTSGIQYNAGGWLFDPRTPPGTPDVDPVAATGWQGWIDWPAFWNPKAITYSYADGSTETYSLANRALPAAIEGPPGAGYGHGYPEPAIDGFRRDWWHFRERLFPGVIPRIPFVF